MGVNDNHLANDIISLGDPNYWNKHFCAVVTESVMHSDVFLSEKTFKPLIGLRPFIILGDGGLYDKLKELMDLIHLKICSPKLTSQRRRINTGDSE